MSIHSSEFYAVQFAQHAIDRADHIDDELNGEAFGHRAIVQALEEELKERKQILKELSIKQQKNKKRMDRSIQQRDQAEAQSKAAPNPEIELNKLPVERRTGDSGFDPITFGAVGGQTPEEMDECQEEYLRSVYQVRSLMAAGKIDDARAADLQATSLLKDLHEGEDEDYSIPELYLLSERDGSKSDEDTSKAQYVKTHSFVQPRSNYSKEELKATFDYLKENPDKAQMSISMDVLTDAMHGVATLGRCLPQYPKNVNRTLLTEIRREVSDMSTSHDQLVAEFQEAVVEGDDVNENPAAARDKASNDTDDEPVDRNEDEAAAAAQDEEEDENEEAQEDEEEAEEEENEYVSRLPLEVNDETLWCVESAIKNRLEMRKRLDEMELKLPTEQSAPIARYNPHSHFAFESEHARKSIDREHQSLARCQLVERVTYEGCKDPPKRLPYGFPNRQMKSVDIDGDLMACVGDRYPCDIYESGGTFAGFGNMPRNASYFATPETKVDVPSEWKDLAEDLPMNAYAEDRELYFAGCLADQRRNCMWATTAGTEGTVYALSTAITDQPSSPLAMLRFPEEERRSLANYVNGCFETVRCGNCIVGVAETPRICVWNADRAIEEFEGVGPPDDPRREEDGEPKKKRAKPKPQGADYVSPEALTVEGSVDVQFKAGDIASIGPHHLMIAGRENTAAVSSVRLYDLEKQTTYGLLCGTRDYSHVNTQYCVDRHNVVVTADQGSGFVWDLRTFQPSVVFTTGLGGAEIVGVPSPSSMVAFAFTDYKESIQCWDLRMPACHAYTMATGNCKIRQLKWHEGTSTLLAATQHDHSITYGKRFGKYMYGEYYDDETENRGWPSRAMYNKVYFGEPWMNSEDDYGGLVHYRFDNWR